MPAHYRVYNILDGVKEKENVIYRNDDPKTGFVVSASASAAADGTEAEADRSFPHAHIPAHPRSYPTSSGTNAPSPRSTS